MMTDKQALLGMSLFELKQAVTNLGMPEFTAKQIANGCIHNMFRR